MGTHLDHIFKIMLTSSKDNQNREESMTKVNKDKTITSEK